MAAAGASEPRRSLAALADFVLVGDPDLSRLRLAARVVLTALTTAACLFPAARLLHASPVTPLLGVALGVMSVSVVKDAQPAEQRKTHLLLVVPALGAATLAAALAPYPFWAATTFVAVVAVAVAARRFGPRGSALGMLGFLAYFDAEFFGARFGELHFALAALVSGIGIAFVVRFGVIRETPERLLRRSFATLVRQARRVVRRALEPPGASSNDGAELERKLARLNDTALVVDQHLQTVSGSARRALRLAVLDLELAAARVGTQTGPAGELTTALERLEALERAPTRGANVPLAEQHRPSATAASEPVVSHGRGLDPSARRAVQAAVACAAAIAAGHVISPNRWYWAVISAFVVFNQVETSSDTVRRAWHRVLGTVAGVLAGDVLAYFASGRRAVELTLLFSCMFVGFYLLRFSYAWMVFWISALLALLYALLGRAVTPLLEIRVLETLAGAAAGALAATVVLPTRGSTRTATLLLGLMDQLDAYLNAALVPGRSRAELADIGWHLEVSLNELRGTARSSSLAPFSPRTRVLELVDAASSVVLLARDTILGGGADRNALERLDRAVLNLGLATRAWCGG